MYIQISQNSYPFQDVPCSILLDLADNVTPARTNVSPEKWWGWKGGIHLPKHPMFQEDLGELG